MQVIVFLSIFAKTYIMREKLEKLREEIEAKVDPDFDFEVEHWDNGNFDDSYEYGVEVGEEYAYRDLLAKIDAILNEE